MSLLIISVGVVVFCGLLYALVRWVQSGPVKPSNEMLISGAFTQILEGNHSGVLERLRRLYEQTGHDVGIGLALGNLLRSLGKLQVAIRTHKSLTSRKELSAELASLVYTELAADYLASGLLERAREALEHALTLARPDEILARYGEQIYERLEAFDEAAQVITSYGKTHKVDVSQRIALLRCRQAERAWEADEVKAANTAIKKAFSAQKDCQRAFLLNARLLRESGNPEKARAYLNKHAEHFEEHGWLLVEEYKNIAMHDGQEALFLDYVEKHLQREPQDWRSRAIMAQYLLDIGEYERAAEELLSCLEIAPRILVLHQRMWSLLIRTGDMDAMSRYRTLVKAELIFSKPYHCSACGHESETIQWRCPRCTQMNTYIERKI